MASLQDFLEGRQKSSGHFLLHIIPDPMFIPPFNRVHEHAVDQDAEMQMVTPG
jgi:hypothetical protein